MVANTETPTTTVATHPDLFRDVDAAAYLKLPSKRAFDDLRREFKVRGRRIGRTFTYHRDQLDYLAKAMFGMDQKSDRK